MKAYLINPSDCTVREVDYDGDWKSIAPLLDCRLFDVVRIGADGDCLYVDDEALLAIPDEGADFFRIDGYPQPIVGRALYLGTDGEGNSTPPRAPIADVLRACRFEPRRRVFAA